MFDTILRIDDPAFAVRVGRLVREARLIIGWSQAELAARAGTSQATVSRIERGEAKELDAALVVRLLAELGMRGALDINAPHLADRRRQREPVHARMGGMIAHRLDRGGWAVATEVRVGAGPPRGWIDVLGFREADAAGLIVEVKGDIPDAGALQRQVAFYLATAHQAAASLGWHPVRFTLIVAALDSEALHERIAANRDYLQRTLPGSPLAAQRWLDRGGTPPGHTLAFVDPLSRSRRWLLNADDARRRSAPAYRDYADAARALLAHEPTRTRSRETRGR